MTITEITQSEINRFNSFTTLVEQIENIKIMTVHNESTNCDEYDATKYNPIQTTNTSYSVAMNAPILSKLVQYFSEHGKDMYVNSQFIGIKTDKGEVFSFTIDGNEKNNSFRYGVDYFDRKFDHFMFTIDLFKLVKRMLVKFPKEMANLITEHINIDTLDSDNPLWKIDKVNNSAEYNFGKIFTLNMESYRRVTLNFNCRAQNNCGSQNHYFSVELDQESFDMILNKFTIIYKIIYNGKESKLVKGDMSSRERVQKCKRKLEAAELQLTATVEYMKIRQKELSEEFLQRQESLRNNCFA